LTTCAEAFLKSDFPSSAFRARLFPSFLGRFTLSTFFSGRTSMTIREPHRLASAVRSAMAAGALVLHIAAFGQSPANPPDPPPQPTKQASAPACVSPSTAIQQPNKDICVSAHVYNVVELTDGTRFLDVCPPDLPDDACRFTIISLPADRPDVGDLGKFRDHDVQIRGIVRATHGRLPVQRRP
jgi:hypothetical protein